MKLSIEYSPQSSLYEKAKALYSAISMMEKVGNIVNITFTLLMSGGDHITKLIYRPSQIEELHEVIDAIPNSTGIKATIITNEPISHV